MDASSHGSRIRFGKFEVDLRSGELRANGQRIRIQPQPIKVLALLLERPGELVTREELRKRLWPGELYVDFEHGLNRSINKLRRALLDEASSPIYIETLSTRGYRFIAPVELIRASSVAEFETTPPQSAATSSAGNSGRKRGLIFTAGCLVIVAVVIGSAWRPHHSLAGSSTISRRLSPVPLVTFANGQQWHPAFSPDGSRIAYSLGTREGWYLEVKDSDGDTHVRLTRQPAGFPPGPAWSPDGRQIAFVRADETDDRGIFIISAIGGPEKKLRSLAPWRTPQRVLSWSPDGQWIAFADQAPLGSSAMAKSRIPNAIYLISPRTFETRQLTQPDLGDYGDTVPTFSPDGATIAFVRTRADSHGEIYTIPAEGGTPRRLFTDGLLTNGLTWSADGKWIIYDRSLAGGFQLWRVTATGSDAQPLDIPSNGEDLGSPTVWHDRLAYESHHWMRTVGRIALNGSHQVSFDTPVASTRHEKEGKYSSDGKHIAFISDRTGAEELWMTDSDGANPVQLTHLNTPLSDLSWAPRGNAIALITDSGKIFLVSLENAAPRLLLGGLPSFDDSRPTVAFSRNGEFLYVLSQPGNTETSFDLLKVPVAGGAPLKVMSDGITNFAESMDGRTLFFSREDGQGLWNREDGLWKRPSDGGPAQFLGPASFGRWDIGPDGIYLLTRQDSIEQYSLKGKRLRTVAKLNHVAAWTPLSISPDGRWALFGYSQKMTTEIDVVQGFH